MTPAEFQCTAGVSRETRERLEAYVELLLHWNRAINLIGKLDRQGLWRRHILDCAQLVPLVPVSARSWLDLGSGAGLPGIVCAIVCVESCPSIVFTLVESDERKAAFLNECAHRLKLPVTIQCNRIEDVELDTQDVITARALAGLYRLAQYVHRFCGDATCLLFPKGGDVEEEITAARRHWHFHAERIQSISDPSGIILKLTELRPNR